MKLPSYTITNLTVDYLIKHELALERINKIRLPHTHQTELEMKLQTEDIQNMSELIGYPIGFDQAEKVQQGKVLYSAKKRLLVFTNYRSGLEFARSYSKEQFIPPSVELLSHINKLTMQRILEDWDAGKVRAFSDLPNEIYDTWYGLRDYYPDLNTEKHFDDIFRWVLKKDNKTHKLIKLAVLLYELIDKAPMHGGNQITSVLACSIIAKDLGYNPNMTLSFMKAINFIQEDFASAFKMSKSKRDLTIFIEVFLYSLSLEMLNLENTYSTTFEIKVKQQGKLASQFNTRQIKVLEYLGDIDKITRNEYRKMMGTSFMTAYRDLQDLVAKDYIQINGVGRGTFYSLIHKEEKIEEKPEMKVFGE